MTQQDAYLLYVLYDFVGSDPAIFLQLLLEATTRKDSFTTSLSIKSFRFSSNITFLGKAVFQHCQHFWNPKVLHWNSNSRPDHLLLIFCAHKSKACAKIECANFSASPADCLIRTSYSLREVQRNKFSLWHKRYYCCGIETYSNGFVYSYVHNWPGKLWQQTRFMFSQITLNCKITKLARIWRNSHTYTFSSKNTFFLSKTNYKQYKWNCFSM